MVIVIIFTYTIYITARGISNTIGGFAGATTGNSNQDFFNRNIYLSKINLNGFDGSGRIGGFAGIVDLIDSENIYLNNITLNRTGTDLWIGGFTGSFTANCNNIFLNNININFNNSGGSLIGGFAGDTLSIGEELKIENVFLQDIDIINKGESDNYIGGGFIGFNGRSPIYFSNIVLDQLYIDSKKNGYTGGFIGYYDTDYNSFYPSEFKNIFIFFKENTKISSGQVGKFFGKIEKESIKSLSNIHIYHHENDLSNAIADQNYWGNTNDKINIHTYNDINKDEVYNKFKEQADTISKPMLPIMPPPKPSEDMNIPDVEDIKNETATLDENDLISDDIWDYIINDIDKVHYNIDIRLLAKLLNEYSDISNKTEDEQVKFITTYLGVKENDARALLQSLSFLNAYKDHDINKAKFKDETVKDSFEKSFKNAGAKFTNFNDKKNTLYKDLKDLNENSIKRF
ncbi:hypothetical protein L8W58_08135 [Campylobacter lari]|nr:hypothetical protein [Campylobacter lari]